MRLRSLGNRALWIRPGTDDPWILRETFTYADQLPPEDLWPRLIIDLGANIGASMALLAETFPSARVIGLEPDTENAALCRRNIEPWGDRCDLVEAAAWPEDGTVVLAGESHSALAVRPQGAGHEVPAISLSTLIDRYAGKESVDYLKLDVEGAERVLLSRNTEWAARVRCISVEVHEPYRVEDCATELRALGFTVGTKTAPREPRVVGRRQATSPGAAGRPPV